jgi:integrase
LIDRNVLRDLHAVLAQADLPKMRMHDLRHSCASLLLAQGVSDRVVQEILGHSDIRLTKAVYQHVYDESRREAADAIDNLLGQMATKLATKTPRPA